ncbi:MAG: glycosyltransferase [Kineosporiaceae bacterium]
MSAAAGVLRAGRRAGAAVARPAWRRGAWPVLRRVPATRSAVQASARRRDLAVLVAAKAVDVEWYGAQAGRSFASVEAAAEDYLRRGSARGWSPHPLLEPAAGWGKDAKAAGMNAPLAAYLRRGRAQRGAPHPLFDVAAYLAVAPKAAQHRWGPWGHFVQHARPETPLPVPPSLLPEGLPAPTWGAFRAAALEAVRGWARQTAIADPKRLSDTHDAQAEEAVRAEAAAAPAPAPQADGSPLVSVVTAVRNRPHQVLHAIASVVAQTMPHWELIVVDDGSSDATPDVVAEIAAREPRVRLLRRPASGVSAARNAGAEVARGRYVAWLDSDNTWLPDYLDVMVRVLPARGWRAGYSACEFVSGETTSYREFEARTEHLEVGNVIDLNVLVVERALLEEVGGFDPGLPRAVDYDLAYKLALATTIGYVPFIGVVYQDEVADPDRISNKELSTWNYVVRDRHVVGWPGVADAVGARRAGMLSVVVSGREDWRRFWASVTALLAGPAGARELEVVVVDGASRRDLTVAIAALGALDPRVRVVRTVTNYNVGGGFNVGLAASTGAVVASVAVGVRVAPATLGALADALDAEGVVAAAPALVTTEGVVAEAGRVVPPGPSLPVPVLEGHPAAELDALGGPVDVPALGRACLVARAADLVAARGFDPLYVNFFDDVDLCLRLREAKGGPARCVLVPSARAVVDAAAIGYPGDALASSRRLFAQRWRERGEGADAVWSAAGLRLVGYEPVPWRKAPVEEDVTLLRALLARREGAALRCAVEVHPELPAATGAEVVAALRDRGVEAALRPASARTAGPGHLDDVVLVLAPAAPRTPAPLVAVAGRPNVLVRVGAPDAAAPPAASASWSAAETVQAVDGVLGGDVAQRVAELVLAAAKG